MHGLSSLDNPTTAGLQERRPHPIVRSLLYVPASSERFIAKAHERGADAIILDLEDSVVPREKAAARERLRESVPAVGRNGAIVFVRINSDPDLGNNIAPVRSSLYSPYIVCVLNVYYL